MIRVLPVDDETMIRAGARAVLAADPEIEVVVAGIHAVADGAAYLSPRVARWVVACTWWRGPSRPT
jgi:DNA-binding NarL/FixJ family response regulator